MAYSNTNKEKIQYLLKHPNEVYNEYITKNKTTVQLADEWGIPKSTVYIIVKKLGFIGIKQAKKLTYCDETLFSINNPIFCYLAGLVSVDGYIDEKNHRVCLRMSIQAKEVLEKLKDYFKVSNDIAPYTGEGGYTNGYTMYDLTISSKKLLSELRKLNIYGRKKDLLRRFPDMQILSDECQEMYIRGVWDGDGTIRSNGTSSIFEQSYDMIIAIAEFLRNKLSISYTISDRIRDNTVIGYDLYFGNSVRFYKWLYRHNMNIKIDCKYKRQF